MASIDSRGLSDEYDVLSLSDSAYSDSDSSHSPSGGQSAQSPASASATAGRTGSTTPKSTTGRMPSTPGSRDAGPAGASRTMPFTVLDDSIVLTDSALRPEPTIYDAMAFDSPIEPQGALEPDDSVELSNSESDWSTTADSVGLDAGGESSPKEDRETVAADVPGGWQLVVSAVSTKRSQAKLPLRLWIVAAREAHALRAAQSLTRAMPSAEVAWITYKHTNLVSRTFNPTTGFQFEQYYKFPLDWRFVTVVFVVYDVDGWLGLDDEYPHAETVIDEKVSFVTYAYYYPHRQVPVTTQFLGSNELNLRANITASVDAPMLRSAADVYTPLTLDHLDVLRPEMLRAMTDDCMPLRMTVPEQANIWDSWWPALLNNVEDVLADHKKHFGRLPRQFEGWRRPAPSPSRAERRRSRAERFGRYSAIKLLAIVCSAVLMLFVCRPWPGMNSPALVMAPTANGPAPGVADLQLYERPHPTSTDVAAMRRFFAAMFGSNHEQREADAEPNGVSRAVASSTEALIAYVRYLHHETLRRLAELSVAVVQYSRNGQERVHSALHALKHSERVARANQRTQVLRRDLERQLDGAVAGMKYHLAAQWNSAGDFGRRGSQQLAHLYTDARDSEPVAHAAEYARYVWARASEKLEIASSKLGQAGESVKRASENVRRARENGERAREKAEHAGEKAEHHQPSSRD